MMPVATFFRTDALGVKLNGDPFVFKNNFILENSLAEKSSFDF